MCTDLVWVDIVCAFFLTKMPRTENRCNIKHVKKLIFNHLSGSLQNATKSNFDGWCFFLYGFQNLLSKFGIRKPAFSIEDL